MTKNKKLIENVCGLMYPGAIYPLKVLKERYAEVFEGDDFKSLASALRSEGKKSNPKIVRYDSKDDIMYLLNDKFNWDDEREVVESTDVKRMAKVIYDMIQTKNKEALDKWLNDDLYGILDEMTTDKVKEELKKELVPLIKNHIETAVSEKFKLSKPDFKKLLLGVISDMIKCTDEEIGG